MDLNRTLMTGLALILLLSGNAIARPNTFTFVLGIDASASVPELEFAAYKEHAREVLQLTRPGDTLVIRRLEDPAYIDTTVFGEEFSKHRRQVVEVYHRIAAMKKRSKGGDTLFNPILSHVVRQIGIDRTLDKKAANARRYVAVLFTDGAPDDRPAQALDDVRPLAEADWRLLVLGLHEGNQAKLEPLVARAGFEGEGKVFYVPYAQLGATLERLPRVIGRDADERVRRDLAKFGN